MFRVKMQDWSARQAKKWARTKFNLPDRPDWKQINVQGVMKPLIDIKFALGSELASMLLDTGEAHLTEGNWWHDNWWGNCICEGCKEKRKYNNLGILLMERRDVLSKGEPSSPLTQL